MATNNQNPFKKAIKTYLDSYSQTDLLFAVSYAKPNKNIDDCCTYIENEVKKSGRCGFHPDEIYEMAIHYYDEDNIEIGKKLNAKVVVGTPLPAEKKESTPRATAPKKTETPKVEPTTSGEAVMTVVKNTDNNLIIDNKGQIGLF